MYEPMGPRDPRLAFLWPAFVAASAGEFASVFARHFIGLAGGNNREPTREPSWATPNTVVLELKTMRLRDFSTADAGVPALICAPFALHRASVTDLAPGHSLVAALRRAGLARLFVTDWRSATPEMRFLAIDDYLSALNVAVDRLGGCVDVIGLCQGGWMSLLYAARFPGKVRKLVLAGAPVDIAAAPSPLSALTDTSPLMLFHELVNYGDGLVRGRQVQKFWGAQTLDKAVIRDLLQALEPPDSPAFATLAATFDDWNAATVDLPGTYYLEVIEKLYRHNEIAAGKFVALGETIDLKTLRCPLYLLAARDDELVAPEQLFGSEALVGTPQAAIRKAIAPCKHVGLFVGRETLAEYWPHIARWLIEPDAESRALAA
jgi:poly(3-hydroxyalkanoate) synthetase